MEIRKNGNDGVTPSKDLSVDIEGERTTSRNQDISVDPLTEGSRFLGALKEARDRFNQAMIVFHNDMDGFASSLLAYHLLAGMGYSIRIEEIEPSTHIEIANKKFKQDCLYLFVDIRPRRGQHEKDGGDIPDHFFCVDHHISRDREEILSPRYFIFCTHDDADEFPPTATSLMAYLLYLKDERRDDYHSFMRRHHSEVSPALRYLILQATIADHLWLLSGDAPYNGLKEVTTRDNVDVELHVRLSITTSLMLGRSKKRMEGLSDLYSLGLDELNEGLFRSRLQQHMSSVEAIFGFVERIRGLSGELSEEVSEEIRKEVSTIETRGINDEERLKEYREGLLRAEEEGGATDREAEFYSQETQKIENRLNADTKRRNVLADHLILAGLGSLEGLALFLPPQENEQTRGILASLLYFYGWKNIIIEGSEERSTWSSRGFMRVELERLLTTVTIRSPREFDEFKLTDDAIKKHPDIVAETGLTPEIRIISGYSGGMGGRGKIFGGIITGQALPPGPLPLHEEGSPEMMEDPGELPDRKYWSPAVQAIRNRFFEDNRWLTIQVGGGRLYSSILENKFDLLIVHFVGTTRTLRMKTNMP